MDLNNNFIATLGKALIPENSRAELRVYMRKSGFQKVPYLMIGLGFIFSLLITLYLMYYFNAYTLVSGLNPIFIGLLLAVIWIIGSVTIVSIVAGGFYFYLNMRIYNRQKVLEENLPEFLILVSTNLKGGLSFEKSLWGSIKPEFGLLSQEMSVVSKKVMTGTELTEALNEFTDKYDSPTLTRTINIIVGQIESGGEVAEVLDHQIDNLRKTKVIKEEMSANTLSFTIFIGAIVIVISPLLFALAFTLLEILIDVSGQIGGASGGGGAGVLGGDDISFDDISVDEGQFRTFSIAALVVISFFSSLILSIIQKGDIRGGLKYMPFFIASAIIMYLILLSVFGGFFGGIF